MNRWLLVRPVVAAAATLRDPLVWCFLPTPAIVDVVRRLRSRSRAVIYYCVSDFAAVTTERRSLRASEDRLLSLADLVFVNGHTLARRFDRRHGAVRIHPFGADTRAFALGSSREEPPDLAAIPRPRAGYIGGLHRHLALDWIEVAARRLPGVSFVLLGPPQADTDLDRIAHLENVHLLGPRPHGTLPAYVQGFDVCLIPYQSSEYTASVVPTKLFEYMAMGKPVVTSALPEVVRILDPDAAVELARDAAGFAAAVERAAMHPPDERARQANMRIAGRYSWDRVFEEMLGEITSLRAPRTPGAGPPTDAEGAS